MSTWKYNRMYAARARTPVEKVTDATIPTRIDAILNNGICNDWEKNFCTSIKESFTKYQGLTKGQYDTFVKVESRYDSAAVTARNNWNASWDASKKAKWDKMIEYYSKTPYYKGATDKVRVNPNYIPSEKEYAAICENKYAVKMLAQQNIPPKYKMGELVVYKEYGNYHLATVVVVGNVESWVKGSREYKINIVGDASLRTCEERDMLYYRESIIPKLSKKEEAPF